MVTLQDPIPLRPNLRPMSDGISVDVVREALTQMERARERLCQLGADIEEVMPLAQACGRLEAQLESALPRVVAVRP